MDVKVYNQSKKVVGKTRVPAEIFGVEINPELVHQVVVAMLSRRRVGTAKTKTRAERRGGGRKPWRQKGTGRARAGSLRSPIFKKGGIVFGPSPERNYKKKINKKMKKKAFLMSLSSKVKDKEMIVLDKITMDKISTKAFSEKLKKFKLGGKKTLLVMSKKNDKIEKSSRNLPWLTVKKVSDFNILDVLENKWLLITKDALTVIKEKYQK